ncbi:MAG: hypothetical protein MSQ05_04655 [Akkermansia sp.]|nr:hypothetical protein [Akkermansia sp.]
MQYTSITLGFTSGELTPWLSSRFDLQAYRRGAAQLQNLVVQPYGGLRRRRGTHLVAAVEGTAVRLFPFRFSTSDALLLELRPGAMRVYRGGVLVRMADGRDFVPVPWNTPEMLRELRMCRINDVVYATTPLHPPMLLCRYADDNWIVRELLPDPFPRASYLPQEAALRLQPAADGLTAQLQTEDAATPFTAEMEGREPVMVNVPIPARSFFRGRTFDTAAVPLPDLSSATAIPGRCYYVQDSATQYYHFYTCIRLYTADDYCGSADPADYPTFFFPGAMRPVNGAPIEVCGDWEIQTTGEWNAHWELLRSYDSLITRGNNYRLWSWTRIKDFSQDAFSNRQNWALTGCEERPCRLLLVCRSASALTVPACVTLCTLSATRRYTLRIASVQDAHRATAEVLSYYGDSLSSAFSRDWSFGAFGVLNGYPRFTCFHQGRLWLGGMDGCPTTLLASAVDDFGNFGVSSQDDAALHLTLSTPDQSRICWLCPARSLLVGSTESEWTLAAADGSAVTASNAVFTRHSSVGSAMLPAVAVENTVFFARSGGKRLREISYKLEADGYTSTDASLLAEHLFESGIVRWAPLRTDNTYICAVLGDGSLAVLTFDIAQQVVAWQHWVLQGRRVLDLATLPAEDGSGEELWLAVQHAETGDVSLERMMQDETYTDGTCTVAADAEGCATVPHLAGLRVLVFPEGKPQEAVRAQVGAAGELSLPSGAPGERFTVGAAAVARLQTMPLEQDADFNAVRQFGRAKLRLLDSDPAFLFRCSSDAPWETFDPAREHLSYPFTGAVRLSLVPAPATAQSLCLRCDGVFDFRLLSLTVDTDYHGR